MPRDSNYWRSVRERSPKSVSTELVREQIEGETLDPKRSDQAREEAVAQLGQIDVDKVAEGMEPDEYRVMSGSVYDKERPHLASEGDIEQNAAIRRGYQKLNYVTSSFREAEEDIEIEPSPIDPPAALQAVRDDPLTASAYWGPNDEKGVKQGVTNGVLVADRFKVAPAKGFRWAEEPRSGKVLPALVRTSEEIKKGQEYPDAFDVKRGGEERTAQDRFWETMELGQQWSNITDPNARMDLMQQEMDSQLEGQDWLRALEERRSMRPHPQLPPASVYLDVDASGRLTPKSKDPEIQSAIEQKEKEDTSYWWTRWATHSDQVDAEVKRLIDLGYPNAAKRHAYESYHPALQETGLDLLDAAVLFAEGWAKFGAAWVGEPASQRVEEFFDKWAEDEERDVFRALRADTWARLTDEGRERAATDPAFFLKKMYEQREIFVRTAVEQANLVSAAEEWMRSRPEDFPPGRLKREPEVPFYSKIGIHFGEFRQRRVEDLLSEKLAQYIELDDDGNEIYVYEGKEYPISGPTLYSLLGSLPSPTQQRILDEVHLQSNKEISELWNHIKRLADDAKWNAHAEVEGFRIAGSGISFYDPDYLQTTANIAKGDAGWFPWMKDIPGIGPHIEGFLRPMRAGMARTPSMHMNYFPGDWGWGQPMSGPTEFEFRSRRGADWLLAASGTTWGAGMMDPARRFIMEKDTDTGDKVYRSLRSLTNSPYEYVDAKTGDKTKLIAMHTEDYDWFTSRIDDLIVPGGVTSLLAKRGLMAAGKPVDWVVRNMIRLGKIAAPPDRADYDSPEAYVRAKRGWAMGAFTLPSYKQYNKETKEMEVITQVEVLADYRTTLEETYDAYIGPYMTPAQKMQQVQSIRQHKFLALEMGETFGHLADSLEVDANTKNAMMIAGGLVLGFGPEFVNPIDPIYLGMVAVGKGFKASGSWQRYKTSQRPARAEKNSEELEAAIIKSIDEGEYTNINSRMRDRMMLTDPGMQLLAEARAAFMTGYRQSVVHHLDKAAYYAKESRKRADEKLAVMGWVEPTWKLPGSGYATPIDRVQLQNQHVNGYKKYVGNGKWVKVPGFAEAITKPKEARQWASDEVAGEVKNLITQISRTTHDQDVYVVLRTEDYIKQMHPEAWEVAKAEQLSVLRLEEGKTSNLYPVFLGKLEDAPTVHPQWKGSRFDESELRGWSKVFKKTSEIDEARWVTVRPEKLPDDVTKVGKWTPIQGDVQEALFSQANLSTYGSEAVFGGAFKGNNGLPSIHKNPHGRVWSRESGEGDLPAWFNEKTMEWEQPRLQDMTPEAIENYERWHLAEKKGLEIALESLEKSAIVAGKVAEEFKEEHGQLAKHFDSAQKELNEAHKAVQELGSELGTLSTKMNPGLQRRGNLDVSKDEQIVAARAAELKISEIDARFPKLTEAGGSVSGPRADALMLRQSEKAKMGQARAEALRLKEELAVLRADPEWVKDYARYQEINDEIRQQGIRGLIAADKLIGVDLAITTRGKPYPIKLGGQSAREKYTEAKSVVKELDPKDIIDVIPGDTQVYSSIVQKRLDASAARSIQAVREQRNQLQRFTKIGEIATEKGRVETAHKYLKEFMHAENRAMAMAKAYREIAADLRKGKLAKDTAPEATSRAVDAIVDSGALISSKEPTAAHRFMAKFSGMIRGYDDDGTKLIDGNKLLDHLNDTWGSKAVDYVTEAIRPEGRIYESTSGRVLVRSEVEIMNAKHKELSKQIKELRDEGFAYWKSDEFASKTIKPQKDTVAEVQATMDNFAKELARLRAELPNYKVIEATSIGSRGGRAGDVLRKVKQAAEASPNSRINLTLDEIEDFRHINEGLRNAWRETHVDKRGLNYIEALEQADTDVFGSLAMRAAYFSKPIIEQENSNVLILASIFDKSRYVKSKKKQLILAARRMATVFDPIKREIGETTKSVENVYRASKNLSEHAGEEIFEFVRMIEQKHKGMSQEFRNEAVSDAILDYLTHTKFDEPLRIEYTTPLKNRVAWMPSGGQIWGQMRAGQLHDPRLLDDSETIGESLAFLEFIRKEAEQLKAGGTTEGMLTAVEKYMKSNKFGGPSYDGNLFAWITKQINGWSGPKGAPGARDIKHLVSRYDHEGAKSVNIEGMYDDLKAVDAAVAELEFEAITLDKILAHRFGLADGQRWFARAENMQQSAVIHAFSRMFIPQGHAPSPSRAAVYYHKTIELLRQPQSVDPRWFFDQIRAIHKSDFGTDPNNARSLALGALAAIDGAVMYRSNRLMERAIGGFLTPTQVADANKFLNQSQNTIKNWDDALDAFIRIGRPYTQDVVRTADESKLRREATDLVLSGMDEKGRAYFQPQNIYNPLAKSAERIVKELSIQFAQARTPHEVFMKGTKWSAARLWRTSIVTGLIVPQPRYFYNNFWGDFSQIWLTEGAATATKINFQLMTGVPWWSKNLNKMQDKVVDKMGRENVLGSAVNALFNKPANRIWNGEQGYLRLPDGRLKSYNQIRTEMIEYGILDTMAHEDLLSALSRQAPSEWKNLPIYSPQRAGAAAEDWMQNISWWASYVQQRQRGNFYMEMLRQGHSEKEAAQRTFDALYDWKSGITDWEVKMLAKWIPFYRFWRLALTQTSRTLMQPLIRPGENMVDLHSFGMKNVPGHLVGQTGLNRVRQQMVFREMFPYWFDPELWPEAEGERAALKRTAHALRADWLTSRAVWGWDRNSEDQRSFLHNIKGRASSWSVNALGPFTALDTSEYLVSTQKMIAGSLIAAFGTEEMKNMLADDYEENWIRPTMDMVFPLQKEAIQQTLMTMGIDAGGHYKGLALRLRPGEAWLSNSVSMGIDSWIDPDMGAPMGDALSVTVARMIPFFGTELPGLFNSAWAENYSMQKFGKDFRNSARTADMRDLIDGLQAGVGKFSGVQQRYSVDPEQRLEHQARDVQNAVQKSKREMGLPARVSDLHGGWPREREFISPPGETNSLIKRAPFHVSSMNDVQEIKRRTKFKEGLEKKREAREERRRKREERDEK